MIPFMPSFPSAPNQVQSQGTNNPTQPQAVLQGAHMANSSNLYNGNPTHQFPCSCPHQFPSQLHGQNHQVPVPTMNAFNNQNTNINSMHKNTLSMPNRPPSMPCPSFPNVPPSNHMAFQNGLTGMPPQNMNMTPMPVHGHLCNAPPNMNPNVLPQPNGQFMFHSGFQNLPQNMQLPNGCFHVQNLSQNMPIRPNGQFCSHNVPQNSSQVNILPNGQFPMQNPIQNMNQVASHLMRQNPSVPFNNHQLSHPSMARPNQKSCVLGSQNPLTSNSSFGVGNANMNLNSTVLSNEATQFSNQGQMHQSMKNMQSSGFRQSQGNDAVSGVNNISDGNQGSTGRKNFLRYGKRANMRFQKPHMHNKANTKGNSWPAHGKRGKGNQNKGAGKPQLADSSKKGMGEKHRYLPPNYTEEEIRQWREARKRNFPSKTNVGKKQAEKQANDELLDNDAKVRRQQLKEILAKQAEMGIEVAELPPNYLSEPENQASRKEELENKGAERDDRRMHNKRGKFRNKFDRRENNHGRQSRRAKKQRLGDDDSHVAPKRKPTLLKKLLGAEIKRDRVYLLQVLRFMTLNSFFKDWPEKPLEFPLITVKDESTKDFIGNKSLHEGDSAGDDVVIKEVKHQNYNQSVPEEVDDDNEGDSGNEEEPTCGLKDGGNDEEIAESEGEEGEITD